MNVSLISIEEEFIHQWGVLGSSWGINKTMAQIHALLLIKKDALTTDDIMEQLTISRGNAHYNIKQLLDWSLIRKVIKKGQRKELFLAEKDPWKIFCIITNQRKRRELEPLVAILDQCTNDLKKLKSKDAVQLQTQLKELTKFVNTGVSVMDKLAKSNQSVLMKLIMKIL